LTHVGYDVDVSLLAQLKGVDVIVGGHTHSLLGQNLDLFKPVDGPFPTIVTKTINGRKVCIVQAWEYGHGLGVLDVVFDKKGNVVSCSGGPKFAFSPTGYSPVLNTTTAKLMTDYLVGTGNFIAVEPNVDAKALVDSLTVQVAKFGDEVIATVSPPGICVSSMACQIYHYVYTTWNTIYSFFPTLAVRAYSWKRPIQDLYSSTDDYQRWRCMQLGIASLSGWSLYC
jgi:5'-nucleotidase